MNIFKHIRIKRLFGIFDGVLECCLVVHLQTVLLMRVRVRVRVHMCKCVCVRVCGRGGCRLTCAPLVLFAVGAFAEYLIGGKGCRESEKIC